MQKPCKLAVATFFTIVATLLPVVAEAEAVTARDGMIVSAIDVAGEAGVEILAAGGNAFDAAAATGFALAVAHPAAGNLGGGGFLVGYTQDGDAVCLDFRETAPAAAHRDLYLDDAGEVIEGKSLKTVFASGTPGSPAGLLAMWSELGSGEISRDALLAPAIRLARDGFALPERMAERLNMARDYLGRSEAGRAVFVREEQWKAGDILKQPDLAIVLQRIADEGASGFYTGLTADALVAYMKAEGGLIAHDDLSAYRPVWREAIRFSYHGFEVLSMPPPSSGGLLLGMMLNMLEPHDLELLDWQSPEYIHLLTEVQRRAYADRATHMGDSDFWPVPRTGLLDKTYALDRMRSFSKGTATQSAAIRAGTPTLGESEETTHYSVADGDGNVASVTVTLNASYGSGLMAPGTGFLLNNEMDDFSAKPGVPNLYGVTGGDANAIEPGKRMLSSMSPTVVLRDSRPWLVLGSPGGSTIPTTVLQVFLNAAVFDMDINDAVAAGRHHSQWLPDRIYVEDNRIDETTLDELNAIGHTVVNRSEVSSLSHIGIANCIAIEGETITGAPDPRSHSAAVGYDE